jgi:hypothetical protein
MRIPAINQYATAAKEAFQKFDQEAQSIKDPSITKTIGCRSQHSRIALVECQPAWLASLIFCRIGFPSKNCTTFALH